MKIPKSVRIAGVEYSVKWKDVVTLGNTVCYATIDYGNAEIAMSKTAMSEEVANVSLWHEMCHVIIKNSGMDFEENEERVVEVFSQAINQILQDNIKRLF